MPIFFLILLFKRKFSVIFLYANFRDHSNLENKNGVYIKIDLVPTQNTKQIK